MDSSSLKKKKFSCVGSTYFPMKFAPGWALIMIQKVYNVNRNLLLYDSRSDFKEASVSVCSPWLNTDPSNCSSYLRV